MMRQDLQFGVEIEFITPDAWPSSDEGRSKLAKILRGAGISAKSESYNHENRPHWKLTTDQSIGYDRGIELVSPILKGEDSLQQIVKILKILNQNKMKVSRECGVHVHIGVPDNTPIGFFKNLVRFYQEYEETIDKMLPNNRRGGLNTYIKSIKGLSKEEINSANTVSDLRRVFRTDRYYKLNLESFWSHGTVEFRHHSGTLQASKIISWVRICMAMAEKALDITNFPEAILMAGIRQARTGVTAFEGSSDHRRTRTTDTNYRQRAIEWVMTYGATGISQEMVNDALESSTWGSLKGLLDARGISYDRERHGRKYFYYIRTSPRVVETEIVDLGFKADMDSFMEQLNLDPLVRSYINERVEELNV